MFDEGLNEFVFSVVNVWEAAIKATLPKRGFDFDPTWVLQRLRQQGVEELAVLSEHALAVAALPLIHGDPFDRLLVAQAQTENLILLTSDRTLTRYPVRTLHFTPKVS